MTTRTICSTAARKPGWHRLDAEEGGTSGTGRGDPVRRSRKSDSALALSWICPPPSFPCPPPLVPQSYTTTLPLHL